MLYTPAVSVCVCVDSSQNVRALHSVGPERGS